MAKSKGKRKGKKKGKKKKKDMTWDRTMESLFEELVQQRIIKNYPKVRMDSLVSQSSFINDELRSYHTAHPMEKKLTEWFMPGDANPHPAFGDVLRTVKDVCILPMGSVEVHKQTPFQTKSCLICGPRGSGKRTLLNVICTELKATLMDLTATNISGNSTLQAFLGWQLNSSWSRISSHELYAWRKVPGKGWSQNANALDSKSWPICAASNYPDW